MTGVVGRRQRMRIAQNPAATVASWMATSAYATVARCEIAKRLQVAHEIARVPSGYWVMRKICGRQARAWTVFHSVNAAVANSATAMASPL